MQMYEEHLKLELKGENVIFKGAHFSFQDKMNNMHTTASIILWQPSYLQAPSEAWIFPVL